VVATVAVPTWHVELNSAATRIACTHRVQLRPYGSPVVIALQLTISSLPRTGSSQHTPCAGSATSDQLGVAERLPVTSPLCAGLSMQQVKHSQHSTHRRRKQCIAVLSDVSWQTLPCCTWSGPQVEDASATPVLAAHQSKVGCRVP